MACDLMLVNKVGKDCFKFSMIYDELARGKLYFLFQVENKITNID